MKTAQTLKKYKTPLIIAGVGVLGYVAYKVYRKKHPTNASALTQDERNALAKGQKLSYPLTTYQGLADNIFNAWFQNFNIFNPVDEKIVLAQFSKINNDLDIVQLIKAFGKRRAPIAFGSFFTSDVTLPEWVSIGLTDAELKSVNDMFLRKGMTYQF